MFVGHAALAFALVGGVAIARGWATERVLPVAAVAGAFAALPDIDMAYALVGVTGAVGSDALALAGALGSTGNVVHRAVTHSLVLAPPVALLAALRTEGAGGGHAHARPLSALVAVLLVASVGAVGGALAAFVTLLFVFGAVAIGAVVDRYAGLTGTEVFAAALVGLVSHPFGDLFTGEPPAMLYPVETALVTERVALAADPTLHLLAAFGVDVHPDAGAPGARRVADVYVHGDRARVEFRAAPDAAAVAGREAGLRTRPKAVTPPRTVVFLKDGVAAKRALPVFRAVAEAFETSVDRS